MGPNFLIGTEFSDRDKQDNFFGAVDVVLLGLLAAVLGLTSKCKLVLRVAVGGGDLLIGKLWLRAVLSGVDLLIGKLVLRAVLRDVDLLIGRLVLRAVFEGADLLIGKLWITAVVGVLTC